MNNDVLNKILDQLNCITEDQQEMKQEFSDMKQNIANISNDQQEMKQEFAEMKQDIADISNDQQGMKQDIADISKEQQNMKQNIADISKNQQNMKQDIADMKKHTEDIPSMKITILDTNARVKRIETNQGKHDLTLDLLSRRSIDQEAELKKIKYVQNKQLVHQS